MARPKHKKTEKTITEVSALASFGVTHEEIATYLDISHDTLQRHYKKELHNSKIRANAEVARKLYHKAVVQDELQAMIFWLKTRAQWRTTDKAQEQTLTSVIEMLMQQMQESK